MFPDSSAKDALLLGLNASQADERRLVPLFRADRTNMQRPPRRSSCRAGKVPFGKARPPSQSLQAMPSRRWYTRSEAASKPRRTDSTTVGGKWSSRRNTACTPPPPNRSPAGRNRRGRKRAIHGRTHLTARIPEARSRADRSYGAPSPLRQYECGRGIPASKRHATP